MSDLNRLIDDEIQAWQPPSTPPFAALRARRRRRTLTHVGATAALSLAAVTAAAVVVPGLSGQPQDQLTDQAAKNAPRPAPSPDFTAPPGYDPAYVPAAWLVESVAPDRQTITVRVAGGGCEEYGFYELDESGKEIRLHVWNKAFVPQSDEVGCARNFTAPAVRVELPRRLADDEEVQGQCGDSTECRTLRATVGS